MRTLVLAASFALVTTGSALAESVTLKSESMETITAGSYYYGASFEARKHFDFTDYIRTHLRHVYEVAGRVRGNAASAEGAATAYGSHTVADFSGFTNTMEGYMSEAYGVAKSYSAAPSYHYYPYPKHPY